MMTDLDWLINQFPEEAIFYQGRYFQVKRYGEHQFALSISEPGPCGDKTPHPILKFHYQNHQLAYSYFADFVVSPMVTVYAAEENLPFFKEKMAETVSEFMTVFPKEEMNQNHSLLN
ncbi:hypothetical protein [Streptococcus thoraltensis]